MLFAFLCCLGLAGAESGVPGMTEIWQRNSQTDCAEDGSNDVTYKPL